MGIRGGPRNRRASALVACIAGTQLVLPVAVDAGAAIPSVSISDSLVEPGDDLTISGTGCPPAGFDQEREWIVVVHNQYSGTEPEHGLIVDPDPGANGSFGWTFEGWPGRILEMGVPVVDGSWSVTVQIPDDAVSGRVPITATCQLRSGSVRGGMMRYEAAIYEVDSPFPPYPPTTSAVTTVPTTTTMPPLALEPAPLPESIPIQPTLTG